MESARKGSEEETFPHLFATCSQNVPAQLSALKKQLSARIFPLPEIAPRNSAASAYSKCCQIARREFQLDRRK